MSTPITKGWGLECKSVADFYKETKERGAYFDNKYSQALRAYCVRGDLAIFYRQAMFRYVRLSDVLYHLQNYGSLIYKTKCAACQRDPVHVATLRDTFEKFKSSIYRCIDGEKFKP